MSHDDTKDARELVNQLLDDLEARGWEVRDYNPRVDPYEPIGVTVDLEYPTEPGDPVFESQDDKRSELAKLREVIADLDDEFREDGAPEDSVVQRATERLDRDADEVRIYDRALSSSEVQTIYNNTV